MEEIRVQKEQLEAELHVRKYEMALFHEGLRELQAKLPPDAERLRRELQEILELQEQPMCEEASDRYPAAWNYQPGSPGPTFPSQVEAQPAPVPAPQKRRKRDKPQDTSEVLTVKEVSARLRMDRNEVLRRCRDGSIKASQGNGPGSMWRISTEEAERYEREGPRVTTR